MPLHDNLEAKRRRNVVELNKSGACHLCECTSGARSYRRFVGNDDIDDDGTEDEGVADSDSGPSDVLMRTCMCYGNTTTWPYSLKVCEMCIDDDLRSSTGRIRCCGICGVVACDQDCGLELVEVTDRDEWNNAGCLECRGMESFSEMELFRRRPYPNNIPRATRVCSGCLELFTLFSGTKYQFTCRYFKCNNQLINSDIVETKRSMTPFPLRELPQELLDSIVDFLGGKDLFNCGLVCTALFRKVENMSKAIVTRWNHTLPTGPTKIIYPVNNTNKKLILAEGINRNSLQPPEDGKTWVAVLNQMEMLARDIFYFDFQIKAGDEGAPLRYLRKRDKLSFDCAYSKPSGTGTGTGAMTPYFGNPGLSIRGGQVLVTRYKWHHMSFMEDREERGNVSSIIFSTDKKLNAGTGIHRVIVRYNSFCEVHKLGSIGILRKQGDGNVSWAQTCPLVCQSRMEEHVFGMEYDADQRTITFYKKNDRTNKMESLPSETITEGGSLCFAASLSSLNLGIKSNQLSIRECSDDEWALFLSHTAEKIIMPRIRGRSRRGDERLMRYLRHRAHRDLAGGHGDDDNAARVEVEHMMDMLMEEEIEALHADTDSDLEDDINVENEPALAAAVGAAAEVIP